MSDYRVRLGKYGEKLAAQYLERQGCRVIDSNYYTQWGEIDLIAENGNELLFCEVKTRTSDSCGYPEMAVDYHKVKKVLKAIQIYLNRKNIEKFWRFDIVSVEIDKENKKARLKWFKGIGEI